MMKTRYLPVAILCKKWTAVIAITAELHRWCCAQEQNEVLKQKRTPQYLRLALAQTLVLIAITPGNISITVKICEILFYPLMLMESHCSKLVFLNSLPFVILSTLEVHIYKIQKGGKPIWLWHSGITLASFYCVKLSGKAETLCSTFGLP